MKNLTIISSLLFLLVSCNHNAKVNNSKPYSFFVAGHTYGKPLATNLGLHPPFKAAFPLIKSHSDIEFGILTGDLVRYSTPQSWGAVKSDLKELAIPVFVAPGNHDISDQNLFRENFGDTIHGNRTYRQFIFNNDLFIILDGNIDKWSIKGDQLIFLKETLDEHSKHARNIFVFIHQLIWWSDKNEFRNIKLNWPPSTPDSTNYWAEIEPLFSKTANPVFIFAGDLGANQNATPYLYYKKKSITYLAGGMGNMTNDNFVFVNIDDKGEVDLELIALQGDPHRLGKITNYKLP